MEQELIRYKNVTGTTLLLNSYTILPFAEIVSTTDIPELEEFVTDNTLHKYVDGQRVVPTYLEIDGHGVAANNLSIAQLETLKASLYPYGTGVVSTSSGVTLKSGGGYIKSFTVLAKGTSPTLSLFNNTTASGQKLIPDLNGSSAVGDFPALNIGETYTWQEPLYFSTGLHVFIGGTGTTTVQLQFK